MNQHQEEVTEYYEIVEMMILIEINTYAIYSQISIFFLARRDFDKAVDLLIRIKSSNSDSTSIQQLVYKQKET